MAFFRALRALRCLLLCRVFELSTEMSSVVPVRNMMHRNLLRNLTNFDRRQEKYNVVHTSSSGVMVIPGENVHSHHFLPRPLSKVIR